MLACLFGVVSAIGSALHEKHPVATRRVSAAIRTLENCRTDGTVNVTVACSSRMHVAMLCVLFVCCSSAVRRLDDVTPRDVCADAADDRFACVRASWSPSSVDSAVALAAAPPSVPCKLCPPVFD